MNLAARLKLWLLPALGYVGITLLGRTLRLRTLQADRIETFWGAGRNVIVAFWHGRQLMLPLAYKGRGITILISEHRDGELIARILQAFGLGAVRGSTTRGGARALRQLVRLGRAGADLAVTPDGPRGPRCIAQAGVVELAKLTGLPIVPLTFAASKKNSSGVGIASKSHGRSAGRVSCGERRSGCLRRPTGRSSRRSVWSWKPRSIRSAMKRIAP
jgi:hypothetical protein